MVKFDREVCLTSHLDTSTDSNAMTRRSEYKDLVLACRDVSDLLLSLSSEEYLEGFLFFIAPKIDFRQSCLPNFLV